MSNRNQNLKAVGKGTGKGTVANKGSNKGATANVPKLPDPSDEVVVTQTLKDEEVVITAPAEELVVTATENTDAPQTSNDDVVKTDETVLENPSNPTDLEVKKNEEVPQTAKTEPTEIIPEVVIIKTEEYVPPQPSGDVKIRIKEDHNCCYGDRNFYMKKGQTYNVPPHLKIALSKADLLLPL